MKLSEVIKMEIVNYNQIDPFKIKKHLIEKIGVQVPLKDIRQILLDTKMKVFKFYCGELYYGYAAETKELAINQFTWETGDQYTLCEEIPESEWDKKFIDTWEDNDFTKKPYKQSIREIICGTEPQMIFSNDISSF